MREAATPPERKGTEAAAQSAVEIYREMLVSHVPYVRIAHTVEKRVELLPISVFPGGAVPKALTSYLGTGLLP